MDDNDAEFETYSLAEVAELILPDMADGVRWLSRRLNNGELSGYRVGRTWRMTREDVTALIERHRNRSKVCNDAKMPQSKSSGLTSTSRRRRQRRAL
jgi:excisionase family DNA binding protein